MKKAKCLLEDGTTKTLYFFQDKWMDFNGIACTPITIKNEEDVENSEKWFFLACRDDMTKYTLFSSPRGRSKSTMTAQLLEYMKGKV